ncbi:succinate dehydrogenase cytochrome b subunit [Pedobacter sp. KR3-3]|uniref:Succinate dehydrogenase cytochrome b subunit n=1 Tax=Pedobacter albus TaxID=3113905 RepID=A0ABU7I5A8_9SPHI|nr:succinate dehydrogenase cytochrome b subunit [Pedobacter sp. KR3-3]MEE1944526.1 succinate dehydrogenase cytochrome b subunit [Pedobacter sp. KR3-3]
MKTTTLQYKLWMAATGLFLCFFLVIHLLGNLQLFLPAAEAKTQFNWYSHLLSGNIIIKIIAYVLYGSLIVHALVAIVLTLKKQKANGTKYAYDKRGASSAWYSRNMGVLGTILFIFLVIHFKDFWYQYKFVNLPLDEKGNKDLYTIVVWAFSNLWYVIVYEVALLALGFHLLHGFFSAARTLGLFHPKYVKLIKIIGWVYTLIITLGFMAMPLYVYLTNRL